ncbi:uncharacterized protein MELLADRAFT_114579 [Melampsora larici-populina 98AG31]|uniref:Uncharacterized protein n=1 Tax=Melampsora larici-populina (strain 98AG31 / pathotype 3-4-7) TaxID=747676 RepID=F4SE07_MELLP|nr:uncharacterized protein MELLADRAFT_114579 [Melampsora larici-populina 98AG31]EGF97119.1 hypothetical protein MELLADRAFT_114579 [Melampsora larici-populina 98AG31]
MESRGILPWLQKPETNIEQEVLSAKQLDSNRFTQKPNAIDICSSEDEHDSLPHFVLPPQLVQPPNDPPRGIKRSRTETEQTSSDDEDEVQVVSSGAAGAAWPQGVTMAQMNRFWSLNLRDIFSYIYTLVMINERTIVLFYPIVVAGGLSRYNDHMADHMDADHASRPPHPIRINAANGSEFQLDDRSLDRTRKPPPIAVSKDNAYGEEDDILETSFQTLSVSDQADISMGTVSSIPYYEYIEDLGLKEEGYIYRLKPKKIKDKMTYYDPYEDVDQLEDRIGFRGYSLVKAATHDEDWVVRWIHVYHREILGWYHLKFHKHWLQMASQGRAHCFERALNNRRLKRDLFNKIDGGGKLDIDPVIERWHQNASGMKVPGTKMRLGGK